IQNISYKSIDPKQNSLLHAKHKLSKILHHQQRHHSTILLLQQKLTNIPNRIKILSEKLFSLQQTLQQINIHKNLKRGYSLLIQNGQLISSINDTTNGNYSIALKDGIIDGTHLSDNKTQSDESHIISLISKTISNKSNK
ncbi:hypothetical protein N9A04_00215, partial [Rickettsiales bacterium]|nr:hypothetical protein [Rickettsiales bacterium]